MVCLFTVYAGLDSAAVGGRSSHVLLPGNRASSVYGAAAVKQGPELRRAPEQAGDTATRNRRCFSMWVRTLYLFVYLVKYVTVFQVVKIIIIISCKDSLIAHKYIFLNIKFLQSIGIDWTNNRQVSSNANTASNACCSWFVMAGRKLSRRRDPAHDCKLGSIGPL